MKKGVIITASILIVLGIALFAGALISSGFDMSLGRNDVKRIELSEEESDFSKIKIDSNMTDILIKPSEDGKVSVVYDDAEKRYYTVENNDGTLDIKLRANKTWLDSFAIFQRRLTLTLYLPKTSYENLTIGSVTGRVNVPGGFTFGEITIKASTGDIECKASATGPITLSSWTGDISLENAGAEQISLSVSTGKVTAANVKCSEELYISVQTGKVTLTDIECKELRSEGSTGKVHLTNTVAQNSIKIERGTGDITFDNCDAENITVTATTGDVKGTLRTGKIFNAKTSTGKVRVPESTSGGRCDITTSTGDIEISVIK